MASEEGKKMKKAKRVPPPPVSTPSYYLSTASSKKRATEKWVKGEDEMKSKWVSNFAGPLTPTTTATSTVAPSTSPSSSKRTAANGQGLKRRKVRSTSCGASLPKPPGVEPLKRPEEGTPSSSVSSPIASPHKKAPQSPGRGPRDKDTFAASLPAARVNSSPLSRLSSTHTLPRLPPSCRADPLASTTPPLRSIPSSTGAVVPPPPEGFSPTLRRGTTEGSLSVSFDDQVAKSVHFPSEPEAAPVPPPAPAKTSEDKEPPTPFSPSTSLRSCRAPSGRVPTTTPPRFATRRSRTPTGGEESHTKARTRSVTPQQAAPRRERIILLAQRFERHASLHTPSSPSKRPVGTKFSRSFSPDPSSTTREAQAPTAPPPTAPPPTSAEQGNDDPHPEGNKEPEGSPFILWTPRKAVSSTDGSDEDKGKAVEKEGGTGDTTQPPQDDRCSGVSSPGDPPLCTNHALWSRTRFAEKDETSTRKDELSARREEITARVEELLAQYREDGEGSSGSGCKKGSSQSDLGNSATTEPRSGYKVGDWAKGTGKPDPASPVTTAAVPSKTSTPLANALVTPPTDSLVEFSKVATLPSNPSLLRSPLRNSVAKSFAPPSRDGTPLQSPVDGNLHSASQSQSSAVNTPLTNEGPHFSLSPVNKPTAPASPASVPWEGLPLHNVAVPSSFNSTTLVNESPMGTPALRPRVDLATPEHTADHPHALPANHSLPSSPAALPVPSPVVSALPTAAPTAKALAPAALSNSSADSSFATPLSDDTADTEDTKTMSSKSLDSETPKRGSDGPSASPTSAVPYGGGSPPCSSPCPSPSHSGPATIPYPEGVGVSSPSNPHSPHNTSSAVPYPEPVSTDPKVMLTDANHNPNPGSPPTLLSDENVGKATSAADSRSSPTAAPAPRPMCTSSTTRVPGTSSTTPNVPGVSDGAPSDPTLLPSHTKPSTKPSPAPSSSATPPMPDLPRSNSGRYRLQRHSSLNDKSSGARFPMSSPEDDALKTTQPQCDVADTSSESSDPSPRNASFPSNTTLPPVERKLRATAFTISPVRGRPERTKSTPTQPVSRPPRRLQEAKEGSVPYNTTPLRLSDIVTDPATRGSLYLSHCPGKQLAKGRDGKEHRRNLTADVTDLHRRGVRHIICLLNDAELRTLGIPPVMYKETCFAAGVRWKQYPLIEMAAPGDVPGFHYDVIEDITACIKEGESVLVHCRGGVGRAGLVAACYLIHCGAVRPIGEKAVAAVRMKRDKRAVESQLQRDFVGKYGAWWAEAGFDKPRPVENDGPAPSSFPAS